MERQVVAIDADAIREIRRARAGEPERRRIVPGGERQPGELPGRGREVAARVVVDGDHPLAGAVEHQDVLVAAEGERAPLRVEQPQLHQGEGDAGASGEGPGIEALLLQPGVGDLHPVARGDGGDGGPRLRPALGRGRVVRHHVLGGAAVGDGVGDVAVQRGAELGDARARGDGEEGDPRRPRVGPPGGGAARSLARGEEQAVPRELGELGADAGRGAPVLGRDARRVLVERGEAAAREEHAQALGPEDVRRALGAHVDDLVAGPGPGRQTHEIRPGAVELLCRFHRIRRHPSSNSWRRAPTPLPWQTMSQRPFARGRGSSISLVSPALLFLLVQTASCSGVAADDGVVGGAGRLALEFPRQAPAVLGAGRGFSVAVGGFSPEPALPGAPPVEALAVELPADGAGDIVFRGARGFEARATETGVAGPGQLVERAVSYRRPGGASFWTTVPGGVEEWLHVAAGSSSPGAVATWQITGATLRAHGAVVDLVDAAGAVRVRVTAPAAYAASGRRVAAHLGASGSTLSLLADAGGEALLVDPEWKVAASMSAPRYDHQASLVKSGKVVATGGSDGTAQSLDTASLYDPTADAWTDVGPMITPHICHTATELLDGTVIVAGGLDDNGNPQNAAETYAETGGFTAVGGMGWNRINHAAAILAPTDGRVLVTGGIGSMVQTGVAPHGWSMGSGSVTCWDYGVGGCGGPGATNATENLQSLAARLGARRLDEQLPRAPHRDAPRRRHRHGHRRRELRLPDEQLRDLPIPPPTRGPSPKRPCPSSARITPPRCSPAATCCSPAGPTTATRCSTPPRSSPPPAP